MKKEEKNPMAWNPGASYAYINMTVTGINSFNAEVVGDGRFTQSTEKGRPAIAIRWTGPSSSSASTDRCSFWFNGRGYHQQSPMRIEWRGVELWGMFAVDRATTTASAQDILDDHNRVLNVSGTVAQWATDGVPVTHPGNSQFTLASVAWQGTTPADRKDWVEFCSQIPYDGTEYAINVWAANQPSAGEGFVSGLFSSRKMLRGLPITTQIGFWEPVLEPRCISNGEVCRVRKSMAPFVSSTTSCRSVGWVTPVFPTSPACG